MPKHSDQSPAASLLQMQQGQRLTRLRTVMGLTVQQAADQAGMSRHAWKRMEQAEARLDGVSLAKFVLHHKLPGEYVLTGSYSGMPQALTRELVQVEAAEQLAAVEGKEMPPIRSQRGRKRKTHNSSTAIEAKRGEEEKAD